MRGKWNHNSILGITDKETVKLDFDHVSFKFVRYWSRRAMKHFRLGGFIILKSSEHNYHVVFNRKVSWDENMRIVGWVCLWTKYRRLTEWLIMQLIKKGSTLRVSPKRDKPSPRIVYRYGRQDGQIEEFLKFRRVVRNIMRGFSEVEVGGVGEQTVMVENV